MMAISPLLRVLAAAAVLFLSTPAWSAGQAPPSPGTSSQSAETGIAEARTLMRTDRFDEALAALRPLARGRTVPADVVFLIGLAAIGASQEPNVSEAKRDALLDEAIASFRNMLVERPGLLRVRLELARAFFLKGTDSLARRSFEQVLASKPPPAVAANARRFLSEIWARRARRRWNMYLGAFAGAGHQHRLHLGRGDHLYPGPAVPTRRGRSDDIGRGRLDVDGRGISASAG